MTTDTNGERDGRTATPSRPPMDPASGVRRVRLSPHELIDAVTATEDLCPCPSRCSPSRSRPMVSYDRRAGQSFVVIEHSTRRLAHINVTANPNADWTLQQLREVVGNGGGHRYLIHDRDRIFAKTSTIRSGLWGSKYCDHLLRVPR
jgi:hypothetical protein